MTLEPGNWVKRRKKNERGIVKSKKGRSASVLWMTKERAQVCSIHSLTPCQPPRALVLEGSLDSNLESTRSEENVLRTWLDSDKVMLAYKNIHTIDDIEVIGHAIGKNKPPFVHISCHGDHDEKKGAYITLAPRSSDLKSRIYLNDVRTISVFKDTFEDMPILFSACLLGSYRKDMDNFKKEANLRAIAAFTREVYDKECMLFELLIYQGMLFQGKKFENAVKNAEKALKIVGIKGVKGTGFVRVF
jgi:hypothetical protein